MRSWDRGFGASWRIARRRMFETAGQTGKWPEYPPPTGKLKEWLEAETERQREAGLLD